MKNATSNSSMIFPVIFDFTPAVGNLIPSANY